MPTAGGEAVRLTDSGSCTAPAWSPDGATLAFAHLAHDTPGVPFTRRVGLVDFAAPRTSVRFPVDHTDVGVAAAWFLDGTWLAAIGETRSPVGINRLIRLDLGSGEASVLTADLDRNVMGGGPGYPGAYSARDRTVGSGSACATEAGPPCVPSTPPAVPVNTAATSWVTGPSSADCPWPEAQLSYACRTLRCRRRSSPSTRPPAPPSS